MKRSIMSKSAAGDAVHLDDAAASIAMPGFGSCGLLKRAEAVRGDPRPRTCRAGAAARPSRQSASSDWRRHVASRRRDEAQHQAGATRSSRAAPSVAIVPSAGTIGV